MRVLKFDCYSVSEALAVAELSWKNSRYTEWKDLYLDMTLGSCSYNAPSGLITIPSKKFYTELMNCLLRSFNFETKYVSFRIRQHDEYVAVFCDTHEKDEEWD